MSPATVSRKPTATHLAEPVAEASRKGPALSQMSVNGVAESVVDGIRDTQSSLGTGVSRILALGQLLEEYLESGTTTSFESVCLANDWRYERHHGIRKAYTPDGRLAMAARVRIPVLPRRSVPTTPCATCGSLPVGTYHDGSRRYGCGPHEPIR